MSTKKATFAPEVLSKSSAVNVRELVHRPALQCILDAHSQKNTHVRRHKPKAQRDKLGVNTRANVSLIDKTWLAPQSHGEQRRAIFHRLVEQGGFSAIGPVMVANCWDKGSDKTLFLGGYP